MAVFQQDAFQQDVPFGSTEAFQYQDTFSWIQQQLADRRKGAVIAPRVKRAFIRVVGPQEVAYKRGTSIEFEAVFTDADGAAYDPDPNTVKLQIRKPDATVLTGWNFTDNKYMTKQSTGVYRLAYQTATTDTTGRWTAEVTGASGTNTSLDDFIFEIKS